MLNEKLEKHNNTVPLYLERSLEILLVSDSNLELSLTDSLNQSTKNIIVVCLLVSIFVGSYFKYALYQYMYNKGKEIIYQPIDFLILVQAIVDHLICIFMSTTYTIELTFGITLSEYLGEDWCYITWYSATFGIIYRSFASLGMAILRLFYVKHPYQVRNINARVKMMLIVLVSGIVASTLITIGFSMGNGEISRKQVLWNFCTGRSEEFRKVIHNYSLIRGTIVDQSELIPKLVVVIAILGIAAEFVCYLFLFKHLYSHDEELLSKKILKQDVITKRHQRNAITFLGQFYGFAVEFTRGLLMLYTMKASTDVIYRFLFLISFWVEFGTLSIVEVMTSGGLKKYLPHNR
jgi:hypothetical protein